MNDRISESISIDATPDRVWHVLTQPELMVQWMGTPEMQLKIDTSWEIHTPVIITGFHHVRFENKGTVLQFDPGQRLSYSHWSSVSRLANAPENYSILEFGLTPSGKQTLLSLSIENFPTEPIFKHLQFYWRTTMVMIKRFTEQHTTGA